MIRGGKGRTSCGLPEEMVDHFKVAVLVANEIVKGLGVGFRREFGVLNCGHCISNFKEEERKKERKKREKRTKKLLEVQMSGC